jgi:hypothetical protein
MFGDCCIPSLMVSAAANMHGQLPHRALECAAYTAHSVCPQVQYLLYCKLACLLQ